MATSTAQRPTAPDPDAMPDVFTQLNMWWHRVGFASEKLPPYSEACWRCGGTTRLLYFGGICTDCDGTGLRLGVPTADYKRLVGNGVVHGVAAGPSGADTSLTIANRTARLGVPIGWEQRTPAELAAISATEADNGRVAAQLYRSTAEPQEVYGINVSSVTAPEGFLEPKRLLQLVLSVEQDIGLRAVSRVDRVSFGADVAWLWRLEGTVPGRLLGRPDQHNVSVHCAELWAPVDARTALKILLTAPLDDAQAATDAFNTVVSSWRWNDQIDHDQTVAERTRG